MARNYLGLEIRKPCAEFAADRALRRGLSNVAFLACNANVDLGSVLDQLREATGMQRPLTLATVLFPDPLFKKKHKKRRMLTAEVATLIGEGVSLDGEGFVCASDVLEVAEEMVEEGMGCEALQPQGDDRQREERGIAWCSGSPLECETEREASVYVKGGECYFARFAAVAEM